MDARFYNSSAIDIERLALDLENFLRTQGYQVQHIGNNEQMMVQLKKGGDLEALLGLQAALTITMQRTSGGVIIGTGQQKWVDKAAVGIAGLAIPPLWPLMVTAGFGAVRQVELANKAMSIVDGLVHQQQPNASAGPAPAQP
jgi:hypothetical protein